MLSLLASLFDALLPRHPRARDARNVSTEEIAALVSGHSLKETWIHTLLPYREYRVRAIIQAVKYYGERGLAERVAPYAAEYLLDVVAELAAFHGWQDPCVVPIAATPRRLRERGYNQAALFAKAIAVEFGVRYDEILVRDDRPSQVRVSRSVRNQNVMGTFTAHPRARGQFIILIDDVVESGATLKDARRSLLDAGAKGVIALAIAH